MKTFHKISTLSILFFLFSFSLIAQIKKPKPKPTPKTNQPVKSISAGIVNGKAISLPKPVYPSDLAKARISGTVNVQVVIDENGNVISAKAVSGIENLTLRSLAEEAAMQAKFSPTKLSGKSVKVSGVIVYNFVDNKGYEEKVKILGLGMALSVFRNFAYDFDKAKEVLDIKDFKKEFSTISEESSFEPFLKDIEPISKLESLPSQERIELIDKVSESIKAKFNDSEKWQLEIGKNVGDLFFSLAVALKGEEFDFSKLDEPTIKLQLSKIDSLLYSAPENFPPKVLEKFKVLVSHKDKIDGKKPETYLKFIEDIIKVFQTISPD